MMKKLFLLMLCAVSISFTAYSNNNSIGALNGYFSVSETKQVRFSQGNLQYTRSTKTWSFAEHQYDYIGTDNVKIATDKIRNIADTMDLFKWSKDTTSAKWSIEIAYYEDYPKDFTAYDQDAISNGGNQPGLWRTLTKDEWTYLLNKRPEADVKKGIATVNGVNGFILLPDTWQLPKGVSFKSGFAAERSEKAYGTYQSFSATEWQLMEKAGAVFLPAAGYRCYNGNNRMYAFKVGNCGNYWSATSDNPASCAWVLCFYSDRAHMVNTFKSSGRAVRLVQDATKAEAINTQTTAVARYAGGNGTEAEPYQISDAQELSNLAQQVNSGKTYEGTYFVLTADILLNDTTNWQNWDEHTQGLTVWTPIGKSDEVPFAGIFDGQNHTISGIYIANSEELLHGLFGCVNEQGEIKNLGVTASHIQGELDELGYCGGIVNKNYGTISNCYNTGIVKGYLCIGGITGWNGGTIANCYNNGIIKGMYVYMDHCRRHSPFIRETTSFFEYDHYVEVGGIASINNGTITNCYNTGTITGGDYAGGIASTTYDGTISNCYNTGIIDIHGEGDWSQTFSIASGRDHITNCYYNNETYTGEETSLGVTGKTAAEFASGEVCWLLNRQADTDITWHQTLGSDAAPVLNTAHGIVRAEGKCPNTLTAFKNEGDSNVKQHPDNDQNHYCDICGQLLLSQPAYQDSIYYISNHAELGWFAALVNGRLTDGTAQNTAANAVLTADIFLNDTAGWQTWDTNTQNRHSWTPIGWTDEGFSGTFDGQGHTISGIYIATELGLQGLFGRLNQGTIQNVGIAASYIQGYNYVGGIAGKKDEGVIKNCYNNGTINGNDCVGGLTGACSKAWTSYWIEPETETEPEMVGCYNTGTIRGNDMVGGIVGKNADRITLCYNIGTIRGNDMVGGIVGNNAKNITSCYNIGTIIGNKRKGGIAGYNFGEHYGEQDLGSVYDDCYYLLTDTTNIQTDDSIAYGIIHEKYWWTDDEDKYKDEYEKLLADLKTSRKYDHSKGKTATEFASGEVCWLLNEGYRYWNDYSDTADVCWLLNEEPRWYSDHSDTEDVFWYQTLGVDMAPVLDATHHGVARVQGDCTGCPTAFKNIGGPNVKQHFDKDKNHYCDICGQLLVSKPAYQDSIYYISNHAELGWFAALVNGTLTDGTAQNTAANAVLTADIFLNDTTNWQTWSTNTQNLHSWTPIGWSWTNEGFSGTFDGQGHTISGIYIATELGCQGLFGYLNQGTIQNVGIVASYIQGGNYVGGIAGKKDDGIIKNCYNNGTINGNDCVGGLTGACSKTWTSYWTETETEPEVVGCYNTGTIRGNDMVGGIVGENADRITSCYNIGTIISDKRKGGIAGDYNEGVVYCCYYLTTDTANIQTDDIYDDNVGITAAEFASGKVCWLLNENSYTEDVFWYQTLGVDMAPVLDKTHKTIYGVGGCPYYPARFKNKRPTRTGPHIDNDNDNRCDKCGILLRCEKKEKNTNI